MVGRGEAWSGEGGHVGVLLLHGFTGSPVSMRPLAEALVASGFVVELPLLPGHGTTWQECAHTTWRDWAQEAVDALERLQARSIAQVAVGLSMGGTLTLHLAITRGDELAGIVLINPLLHTSDPRARLLPVLCHVMRSIPGVGNDIAMPGADERAYTRTPLKALYSLTQLWALVQANLERINTPLLVFTSRQDHVVEPANSATVIAGVSSTDVEQVWLERSYHVATLDYDADLITERTVAFVRNVTGR
jgi:carboxylesterase